MGLIKATTDTLRGGFSDQWLEVIEPEQMSDTTLMTEGIMVRKNERRGANKKGTKDVITDGSVIHVYPNMMMILVDGGKIVDFTAEEGYYTVDNEKAPSMFTGNLKGAIEETFFRFKFGGTTPQKQKVYFINLQEIKGIKFGTPAPLNYFDHFYNAELFLRAHGTYSIRIVDPILFFKEAIPHDRSRVDINDINEQYLSEFLTALQSTINQLSANGERISYVPSKSMELSKYMSNVLDEDWKKLRGMEIVSVALASISYTDDSMKLINMRNQGAMLSDPSIREGFVQGSIAKGIENAGSNEAGSMTGFMGLNTGMNAAGGFFSQASANNQQQMQQQNEQKQQSTAPGIQMRCAHCQEIITITTSVPKFCPECGQPFQGLPV